MGFSQKVVFQQDLSDERGRSSGLSNEIVRLNHELTRVEDQMRATSETQRREKTVSPSRFVEGSDGVVDPEEKAAGSQSVSALSGASSCLNKYLHEIETESVGQGQDSTKGHDPLTLDDLAIETEKQPGQRLTELEKEVGSCGCVCVCLFLWVIWCCPIIVQLEIVNMTLIFVVEFTFLD